MLTPIITTLTADAPLIALLTGGIHAYAASGRLGISRATLPTAYDADGYLLPCAIVQTGATVPADSLTDATAGTLTRVIVYLYADGDHAFADLYAARDRIIVLLDRAFIVGVGWIAFAAAGVDERDSKLNHAAALTLTLEVRA